MEIPQEDIARLAFPEREMLGCEWLTRLFAWTLEVGEGKYGQEYEMQTPESTLASLNRKEIY